MCIGSKGIKIRIRKNKTCVKLMTGEIKIFLIDDDASFLLLVKNYLEQNLSNKPYKLFLFNSGEQALLEAYRLPDLIIIDYYLDSVFLDADNGLRIINNFKVLSPNSDVILISGSNNLKIEETFGNYGIKSFYKKNEAIFTNLTNEIINAKPKKSNGFFSSFTSLFK